MFEKNNRGITLIELLIVIAIIGVLLVALGFSFQGWMGGYKVESQVKEMHGDLMNAMANAMNRNRSYFVSWSTIRYTIYEDTNPAPDGNGNLETASDRQVMQKNLNANYPIVWTTNGSPTSFTPRGFISGIRTVRVPNSSGSDYDCVVISRSRINSGLWTTADGGDCVTK